MIDKPILEFLENNGAFGNGHSGRSLIEHLTGTADLLAQWECDKDVVLAGLCHSVYGTDSYHTVTIDHSRRDEVRALIGEKAERLAWEFGNRKNPRIVSFIQNNEVDLVVIECANLIEQKVDPCQLAAATVVELPDYVRTAVSNYLETYN
jgi:(p)ppGpp synthase/HD superfamily hydrolase